jgi:hypothetical protein
MRHHVISQISFDVSEKPTASIFKVVNSWQELRSYERLVAVYEVTLRHVPEECKLNTYCCKNLKTYTLLLFSFFFFFFFFSPPPAEIAFKDLNSKKNQLLNL